MYNLILIGR